MGVNPSQDVSSLPGGAVSQPQQTKGKPSPSFPHTSLPIPADSEHAVQVAKETSVAKEELTEAASARDQEPEPLHSHHIAKDTQGRDSGVSEVALRNGIMPRGAPERSEEATSPDEEGAEAAEEPEEEEDFEIGSKTSKQVSKKPSDFIDLTGEELALATEATEESSPAMQVAEELQSPEEIIDRCLEGVGEEKAAVMRPHLMTLAEYVAEKARSGDPLEVNGYQQGILTGLKQENLSDIDIKIAVDAARKLKESKGIYGDESWGIAVRSNGIVVVTPGAINVQNLKTLPPHIARQVKQAHAKKQIITISSQQYRQQLQKGAAQAKAFCTAFSAAIKNYERMQAEENAKKKKTTNEGLPREHRSERLSQMQQIVVDTKTNEETPRKDLDADEKRGEQKKLDREISEKRIAGDRKDVGDIRMRVKRKAEKRKEIRKEELKEAEQESEEESQTHV